MARQDATQDLQKNEKASILSLLCYTMALDIGTKAEDSANKTIGLVVVLAIIGGTIGSIFTNLGSVISNFTGVSTGLPLLDDIIAGALALLVGILVVFGVIKMIQRATD